MKYEDEVVERFRKGLSITLNKKKAKHGFRTQAQVDREVRRYAKRFDRNNITNFYDIVVKEMGKTKEG